MNGFYLFERSEIIVYISFTKGGAWSWHPSSGLIRPNCAFGPPMPWYLTKGYRYWISRFMCLPTWEVEWEFHLHCVSFIAEHDEQSLVRSSACYLRDLIARRKGARPDKQTWREMKKMVGKNYMNCHPGDQKGMCRFKRSAEGVLIPLQKNEVVD